MSAPDTYTIHDGVDTYLITFSRPTVDEVRDAVVGKGDIASTFGLYDLLVAAVSQDDGVLPKGSLPFHLVKEVVDNHPAF